MMDRKLVATRKSLQIDILTLFPEMFTEILQRSILGKAKDKGLVHYNLVNYRHYAQDKHQNVDDYPYGGGSGMVLKPDPIFRAVEDLLSAEHKEEVRIILLCPQGQTFNQRKAEQLSSHDHLIFICGHYEGYDERIREHLVTDELSIGDYVLTGGELPTMVVIDSVVRLREGVLGNAESSSTDSFSSGYLQYPQYTRPAQFRDMSVPDILLSGHHENIDKWRHQQSLRRTWKRRPDLIQQGQLSSLERSWINEWENK